MTGRSLNDTVSAYTTGEKDELLEKFDGLARSYMDVEKHKSYWTGEYRRNALKTKDG